MAALEMGYELGLRQVQKLVMTPRLQQALQLLQMPMTQLEQLIEEEMAENPVLDISQESDEREVSGGSETGADKKDEKRSEEEKEREEIDWNRLFDTDQIRPGRWERESRPDDDREPDIEDNTGLREHVLSEIRLIPMSRNHYEIVEYLVGCLDDDGYIRGITLDEIAEYFDVTAEEIEIVRRKLMKIDPPGIGSFDLQECLLAQMEVEGIEDELSHEIVTEHLDDFMHKRFPKLSTLLGRPISDIQRSAEIISKLDPKPGIRFSRDEPRFVIPDLIVDKIEGEYVVYANDRHLPRLTISPVYQGMLAKQDHSEAKAYLGDRLNAARWLIKTIEQRRRTMIRVMSYIVDYQRDFFERGERYLRPLTLQEVADGVGMHESTISRVTSGKYVQTPKGVFELKYFFGGGLQRRTGETVSVRAVKRIIRELIENEDSQRPLSDERIAEQLRDREYRIARRTVSKYREQMNILPARLRQYKTA